MTDIDEDWPGVTLVNVFTVEPDRQEELVELLVDSTEETMRDLPGFVSANLHASRDGTRVVNYAQWESKEAFEAILEDSEAQRHMQRAKQLSESFDAHLYDVVEVETSR
jgi:quinol monooxygenase YgiN